MRLAATAFATLVLSLPGQLSALEIQPGYTEQASLGLRQIAEPTPPEIDGRTLTRHEICEHVASAAEANDIPVIFFLRLIWQESRFDPFAVSHAGALGVAQFMPKVAEAIGLSDPLDPTEALPASARFLRGLHQKFGNLGLAAAAYNAGSRRIREWLEKRGKLPQETRNYVQKITGLAPEHWVNPAPAASSVELKMPPAPCPTPETLAIAAPAAAVQARQEAQDRPEGAITEVSAAKAKSSALKARARQAKRHGPARRAKQRAETPSEGAAKTCKTARKRTCLQASSKSRKH